MALQTSGPISVSEILTEAGVNPGTTVTLGGLEAGTYFTINTASSSKPDGSTPNAMSEWYGYDHSATAGFINTQYLDYDGVNDYVQGFFADKTGFDAPNQFTYNLWVRQDNTTKRNWHLVHHTNELNTGAGGATMWQYQASTNRLITYIYQPSGAVGARKEHALHDNSGVTGITNSGTGWVASQRGNTDADGWTMLTITYDFNFSTGTDIVKMYWNGSLLTTVANSTNYNHLNQVPNNFFGVGEWTGNASPSGGCAGGGIDQLKVYSRVLSAAEIATLWNAGKTDAATAGVTSGLWTEMLFEGDVSDTAGKLNLTNNGAIFKTY